MKTALLLVDIQNDFCPGGALAVPEGDSIIPLLNRLIPRFQHVIASQDWHPVGHASFASSHPDKKPGDFIDLEGKPQILWPDHCIQESPGAEFHPDINIDGRVKIIRKGESSEVDSYSAFFDNHRLRQTELDTYLKGLGISRLYIGGLATDYCVQFTALDALDLGYETYILGDACRGVNIQPGDTDKALKRIESAGGKIITTEEAGE